MNTTMKKTMMGAALALGLLTTGAASANAQARGAYGRGFEGRGPEAGRAEGRGYEGRGYDRPGFARPGFVRSVPRFYGGVVVGGPVVDSYIPPCPGDGYVWTAGYYDGGYWVPGAWTFRGGVGFGRDYRAGGYERRDFARGRDFDRGAYGHREGFRNDRAGREFQGRR